MSSASGDLGHRPGTFTGATDQFEATHCHQYQLTKGQHGQHWPFLVVLEPTPPATEAS